MHSTLRRRRNIVVLLIAGLSLGFGSPALGAARRKAPVQRQTHHASRHRRQRVAHRASARSTRPHRRPGLHKSGSGSPPPPAPRLARGLTWSGSFDTGDISNWQANGGGAQCANYGVPSANYHQRGNLYLDSNVVAVGKYSARFDLPANVAPYTATSCELLHSVPLALGSDSYYGYMFYVPSGWTTGTAAFWGAEIAQWHFEDIWGAPISFQLHDDHMTLALETGSCDAFDTVNPGCDWRSQADFPTGPNLPADYVIPPGAFTPGNWYEIIMNVRWAADSSGLIQTWYRQEGSTTWNLSANVSGIPTVQWDRTTGCCITQASDKVGAYRGYSNVPISVWIDNVTQGTRFSAIAATMP
jgi:hypothetical protein